MRKGTVSRVAGKNLASITAQTLVKTPQAAFLEFVSNSYDADAENVRISVNTIDDLLVIEDDGTGMDEAGIENFYNLGDSEKAANPFTAKGRRKIGKFGIATVLLEYLAGAYTLETWKDGGKITITEDFETHTREGYLEDDPSGKQGTRILMRKLRLEEKKFDLGQLKSELEWKAPCLPDFNLFINGILVPKRSVVRYCTEYDVDEYIEGVGRVQGSIYLSGKKKLREPGIFIYVDGRSVGDPQSFRRDIRSSMVPSMVGIINADGLRDYITFDRSEFREDDAAYLAVRSAIKRVIYSVEHDTRKRGGSSRSFWMDRRKLIPSIEDALKSAEARINEVFKDEPGLQPCRLELAVDDTGNWVSNYDSGTGIIKINAANPQLSSQGLRSVFDSLEPRFIGLALYAVAEASISDPRAAEVFRAFDSSLSSISSQLFEDARPIRNAVRSGMVQDQEMAPLSQISLNKYRLYITQEISYITGLDINTIQNLYMCGTLKASRTEFDNKFRKDTIMDALSRIEGYVPIGKVLAREEYDKDFKTSRRRRPTQYLDEQVASAADKPDYLVDAGTNGPFLFVKKGKVEDFKIWYSNLVRDGNA